MRWRTLLAGVAAAVLLLAAAPAGSTATSLSELQKKIETTQGEVGSKKGAERVLTTEISAYSRRIGRLQGQITALSSRHARLQADLDRKRSELVGTTTKLRSQRARMVRLRARLTVAKRTLATRLVELYKSDRPDLVTVVLNAKGFADLLEREEFISRISAQDRQIIKLVRDAKQDATQTAASLASLRDRQQRLAVAVLTRRDQIAQVREQLIGTRVGYQRTRADKANALGRVRSKRRALEGRLDDYRAQEAKIRNALNRAAGPSLPAGPIRQGNGSMIWPVNGPITGQFGEARPGHMHAGLDISAPEGTPIRAAASGTVALMQGTGESGGYGNFTCVAHAGALATCYAHQSRFGTSQGASVSKGDVIGYVGNTGNSFGAHLHFETRIGGSAVSPYQYL